MPSPIFILAAKRTPFGNFCGKLKDFTATELAAHSLKPLLSFDASSIRISTIYGNVLQTSSNAAYLARHAGLLVGLPVSTTALTVNRLCGSGFQAIVSGMQELRDGNVDLVIAGGSENMSQAPFVLRNIRQGIKFSLDKFPPLEDSLATCLTDQHIQLKMGITAENIAKKYGITREACDEFALASHAKYIKAFRAGIFDNEITPMEVKTKKTTEQMNRDELPRDDMADISKLPAVFAKEGVVTAGNSSGITDGAASVLLGSAEIASQLGLAPIARVLGYQVTGCDPAFMGLGPVAAISTLLQRQGVSLDQIDHIEINEAFAAQVLGCLTELGLDSKDLRLNPHGGAIAIGHPLGASGARITAHMALRLASSTPGKLALGAACIGGGQGIALLLSSA